MEFQFTEEMIMKKIDERVSLYKNLLYYAVKEQINGKESDLEDYDYYVNKIEECKRVEIFLQSLFNELKEIDEIKYLFKIDGAFAPSILFNLKKITLNIDLEKFLKP